MKINKISPQFNNCSFHVLSPYIAAFLVGKIDERSFAFKEVTPTEEQKKRFKDTIGYRHLLNAFATFYQLPSDSKTAKHLSELLTNFNHPLDTQLLLGPVLRLVLKQVLLNHSAHKQALKASFQVLVQKCIERYQREVGHTLRGIEDKVAWLSSLKWDRREEHEELFFPNLEVIALLLDASGQFDERWDVAYRNMCEYMGDHEKCIFVSESQFELLCQSFNFGFTYRLEEDLPRSENSRLATVHAVNQHNVHWELVAHKEDTQWDHTQTRIPPAFASYHEGSSRMLPDKFNQRVGLLQSIFKEKIKSVVLNKEDFSEEIFYSLPNQGWPQNSGLESLVEIICQIITEDKSYTPIPSVDAQRSFLQTEGFREFKEEFSRYYELPSIWNEARKSSFIQNLLLHLKMPQERFLLISPILRKMGGAEIQRNLHLPELAALYARFNIGLSMYYSENSAVAEFDKVYENKLATPLAIVRISFSFEGWYPVERLSLFTYTQSLIRSYSPHAAFDASADKEAQVARIKSLVMAYSRANLLPLEQERWFPIRADSSLARLPDLQVKNTCNMAVNGTAADIDEAFSKMLLTQFYENRDQRYMQQFSLQLPKGIGRNWTALHFAVYLGKAENVNSLLNKGANWRLNAYWEIEDKTQFRTPRTFWEFSVLEMAVCLDQRQIVERILQEAKPEDVVLVQKAYDTACNLHKIKAMFAFLSFKGLHHPPQAYLNAIDEKDLFLILTLINAKAPLPFKDIAAVLEFTSKKAQEAGQDKEFIDALQNILLLGLHRRYVQQNKLTEANFVLNQNALAVIRSALQTHGPKWIFSLTKYFNQFSMLLDKEKELQTFVQRNQQLLNELVAGKICQIIEANQTENLAEYLISHPFALLVPGKMNPMHFAFNQGKFGVLEEAWLSNLLRISKTTSQKSLMPDKEDKIKEMASEQLQMLGDRAYDQYDRTLTFRKNKKAAKNQLNEQLSRTPHLTGKLYLQSKKLWLAMQGGVDAVVDVLHEKNKHTAIAKNKPIYKYGTPTIFALKTVGTLASGGVIKYGLDMARYFLPNFIKMPIHYAVSVTGKYTAPFIGLAPETGEAYAPVMLENLFSIALMPSYYLYSTILEAGTYALFRNSGYDNLEALTYLFSDGLAHSLSQPKEDLSPIDERYHYHLRKNLEPFIGKEWAGKVSPAIGQLDAFNRQANQTIQSWRDTAYQQVSFFAPTFDYASLPAFPEGVTGPIQPLVEMYHRFSLKRENFFHELEFEMLQWLEASSYKGDRLCALMMHLKSYQIYLNGEIESELVKAKEEASKAKSLYESSKNEEDRKNYEKLNGKVEALSATFTQQEEVVRQYQQMENDLFKDTDGYAYFEEWQEQYNALKFVEYTKNSSPAKIKASKEAERAAWQKATFYCNEQISQYATSWQEYVSGIFEKNKENFKDLSNVQDLVDSIVDATFIKGGGVGNMAVYCADQIIKILYPLYPDVGDPVAIEKERQMYIKNIATYKLAASREKNRRKDLNNYLLAVFSGQPEQKRVSSGKPVKVWLLKGAANIVSLAVSGGKFMPFPEFFGGPKYQSTNNGNYLGAQFAYNFGGANNGLQADLIGNNVRLVGFYNPTQKFTFALFPDMPVNMGDMAPKLALGLSLPGATEFSGLAKHPTLPAIGFGPSEKIDISTKDSQIFSLFAPDVAAEALPQREAAVAIEEIPSQDPPPQKGKKKSHQQGTEKPPTPFNIFEQPDGAQGASVVPLNYGKIVQPSISQPTKGGEIKIKPPLINKGSHQPVLSPAFNANKRVTRSATRAQTAIPPQPVSNVKVTQSSNKLAIDIPFYELARNVGVSPQTEGLLFEKYQVDKLELQGSLLWGGNFLRALNGDRSPEIIEWQRTNRARPNVPYFRTDRMPEDIPQLEPLMMGMIEAGRNLLGMVLEEATTRRELDIMRAICLGEEIPKTTSQQIANFFALEAERTISGQTPVTIKKGKEAIAYLEDEKQRISRGEELKFLQVLSEKVSEIDQLSRDDKFRLIGRELFNWCVVPKGLSSAGKAIAPAKVLGGTGKPGITKATPASSAVTSESQPRITQLNQLLSEKALMSPAEAAVGEIVAVGSQTLTPQFQLRSTSQLGGRLTKGKLINYLNNIHEIPREQLVKDIESIGLRLVESSPDRRFLKFAHKDDALLRVEIHGPHKSPNGARFPHIHIKDKFGNSLDKDLKIVPYDSSKAHVEVRDLAELILEKKRR